MWNYYRPSHLSRGSAGGGEGSQLSQRGKASASPNIDLNHITVNVNTKLINKVNQSFDQVAAPFISATAARSRLRGAPAAALEAGIEH